MSKRARAARADAAEFHDQGGATEVILRLTHDCGQRCAFCFVPRDGWRVSAEELDARFASIAQEGGPQTLLTLSGGDPLALPDLEGVLRAARARGLRRFGLQTNGVGLEAAGRLAGLAALGVVSVDLSYHSHREPLYDRLTGTSGQFARATAARRILLARTDLVATVCAVVTVANYRELPDWAENLVKEARTAGRGERGEPVRAGFMMLNAAGLERAPDLAVSLEEVRPFLGEAMRRCDGRAVVVPRSSGDCDFPPCLAPAPERFACDGPLRAEAVSRGVEEAVRARGGRAKRRECADCLYDGRCLGVPVEYARAFGLGALRPAARGETR